MKMLINGLKTHGLLSLGILLEWTEYAVYLYLGPVLATSFFPAQAENPLLLTLLIFASGYLVRPIGAWLYGSYSDRHGRRKPLIFSMWLMGIATVGIGVLPGYQTLGWLAPVLLLVLRCLQNLSIAGEFNNATILAMETAPQKRIFYGAVVMAAASLGMVAGNVSALWVHQVAEAWAWRVAFVIIGLLSLAVCVWRRRLPESPAYQRATLESIPQKQLLSNLWRDHRQTLALIFLLSGFLALFVYLCGGYLALYIQRYSGQWVVDPSVYMILTQLMITGLTPWVAFRYHQIAPARLLRIGAAMFCLLGPLLFLSVTQGWEVASVIALCGYAIANATAAVAIFHWLFQLLPTALKCTGIGLAYNLAVACFGSTAPLIAQFLMTEGHGILPGIYLALYAAVLLFFIRRSRV